MNETMIVGAVQAAEPLKGSIVSSQGLTGAVSTASGVSGTVTAEAHLSGSVNPTGVLGGDLSAAYGTPGRDGKDGYTPIKGVDYFDGKDGYTPIKGIDYFDGKDGYTPVKGVDYFDGKDGQPGRDGVDGKPGVDGYTPIKGVDYFDGLPGKDGNPGKDGKDGYTPVKGVDYFDGKDGQDGYTPIKGVDYFDGQPGKDGYTPVKGVDYFDGEPGYTPVKGKDYTDGQPGNDGADGASFWTSTAAPTTPNYTFQVANLNSPLGDAVKVGDIILYSYYRYTVTSVDGDTVLTGSRTSLRGATGAAGKAADVYTAVWSNAWSTPPKGTWEITLYKNGAVCEDTVYAEFFYASSLSAEPTTVSSQTGSFTGTKSWSGSSPYKYLINFYEDDTKAKLLHSEMMAPNAFDKDAMLNLLHPVGSVYVTNTNTNPGDTLGGTWELIDKRFKPVQGNSTSTFFTKNADNVESSTVYYRRGGNSIWIKFYFKNLVALGETNVDLGDFVLSKLGVAAMSSHSLISIVYASDGANGIAIGTITTAGAASITEIVKKDGSASIAVGNTMYTYLTLVFRPADMLDDYCNQFHWQRTE